MFFICAFVSCCLTKSVIVPEGKLLDSKKYEIIDVRDAGVLYVASGDSIVKLKHILYKELHRD